MQITLLARTLLSSVGSLSLQALWVAIEAPNLVHLQEVAKLAGLVSGVDSSQNSRQRCWLALVILCHAMTEQDSPLGIQGFTGKHAAAWALEVHELVHYLAHALVPGGRRSPAAQPGGWQMSMCAATRPHALHGVPSLVSEHTWQRMLCRSSAVGWGLGAAAGPAEEGLQRPSHPAGAEAAPKAPATTCWECVQIGVRSLPTQLHLRLRVAVWEWSIA